MNEPNALDNIEHSNGDDLPPRLGSATRRGFLALAGTGVAVAGVAAAAPSALAATKASANPAAGASAAAKGVDVDGPVVAYVHDAGLGEVAIMHGEREVVVVDHDLVARLTTNLRQKD